MQRRLAQRLAHLVGRNRLAVEIPRGQRLVEVGDRLDHRLAAAVRRGAQLLGHGTLLEVRAEARVVPVDRRLLEQVHDARELVLRADRQLYRYRVGRQFFMHRSYAHIKIGAHLVHFVHEGHARDMITFALPPHRF